MSEDLRNAERAVITRVNYICPSTERQQHAAARPLSQLPSSSAKLGGDNGEIIKAPGGHGDVQCRTLVSFAGDRSTRRKGMPLLTPVHTRARRVLPDYIETLVPGMDAWTDI